MIPLIRISKPRINRAEVTLLRDDEVERQDEVGRIIVTTTARGTLIEVQRVDESATGPVEVTVR